MSQGHVHSDLAELILSERSYLDQVYWSKENIKAVHSCRTGDSCRLLALLPHIQIPMLYHSIFHFCVFAGLHWLYC